MKASLFPQLVCDLLKQSHVNGTALASGEVPLCVLGHAVERPLRQAEKALDRFALPVECGERWQLRTTAYRGLLKWLRTSDQLGWATNPNRPSILLPRFWPPRFVEQALGFVDLGPAAVPLCQLLIQEALLHFCTSLS